MLPHHRTQFRSPAELRSFGGHLAVKSFNRRCGLLVNSAIVPGSWRNWKLRRMDVVELQ